MLKQIPTHVIGGPLGAGKTSLIRDLLGQRGHGALGGAGQRIRPGRSGCRAVDPRCRRRDHRRGGWRLPCCVNGAPFQVGLARLLRKARPDRLFIEPSGLGHPRTLLRQLSEAPWQGVLAPQPLLLVLDAAALAAGAVLPEAQAEALGAAALLLLNKSEGLDAEARRRVQARLPDIALRWTSQGICRSPNCRARLSPPRPVSNRRRSRPSCRCCCRAMRPASGACRGRSSGRGWRLRDWRFRRSDVDAWLATLPGLLRAKAVLHCAEGWLACNRVAGDEPWQPSAWRRDNRIELILSTEQDLQRLQDSLLACAQAPN
jgi:hypothetical protein